MNFDKFRFYIIDKAILKPKCKVKYNHGNIVGKVPTCFVSGQNIWTHGLLPL